MLSLPKHLYRFVATVEFTTLPRYFDFGYACAQHDSYYGNVSTRDASTSPPAALSMTAF
jgi:hypothetical protein